MTIELSDAQVQAVFTAIMEFTSGAIPLTHDVHEVLDDLNSASEVIAKAMGL